MRISMSVSIKIFFRSIIYLAICAVLFLLSNFFLMRFSMLPIIWQNSM